MQAGGYVPHTLWKISYIKTARWAESPLSIGGASNKAPGQSGICIFDEVLLNIKGDIHGCVTILNV